MRVAPRLIQTPWNNGPAGNAATDQASECAAPAYATHDWIADHALDFLPDAEKAWLLPHRALYLTGTEAPDNDDIAAACGAPHTGYDDRRRGHSVDWDDAHTEMFVTRAAARAEEEYSKAVIAFSANRPSEDAALQVCRPRATLRVGTRTRAESLSGRPPPRTGRPPSALTDASLRGLA